ncbi:Dihydrofolate reductase [Penicillium rolfsii]|nr:Dihydrofolate reductase [Penicillium rolfsii]
MAPNPSASVRQPLKILMLHGYTQSGPLFHAKSRALVKHIQKSFPLHEVSAIYPTGPLRLKPSDIPGYEPSEGGEAEEDEIEAYGWFRRSNTADPPLYQGLEDGLAAVAKVLSEEGPFDGVIGFSQGAAMVGMVAGLLETGRKEAFAKFEKDGSEGATGIPYPSSFAADGFQHPQFKFAIAYSGFRSPGARYRGFYESPPVQTPILHVLGSLDAVVEESRSRALIDACAGEPEKDGLVVWHPGGHFLPSQRPYLDAAVRFIREQLEKSNGGKKADDEEDVNDMDVPF